MYRENWLNERQAKGRQPSLLLLTACPPRDEKKENARDSCFRRNCRCSLIR